MDSNIRYANVLVIALSISYAIIGVVNLIKPIDGKVILLTAIVSLVVAIVQIIDTIISALKAFEINVLKVSIGFLQAWSLENSDKSYEDKNEKSKEFRDDHREIHKSFGKSIRLLRLIANVLLIISMVIFVIGLTTNVIKQNTKVADTLSLFSFALMFLSFTVQTYLEKYINAIEKELDILFCENTEEDL